MTCFDYDDLCVRLDILGFPEESKVSKAIMNLAATLDNEELDDEERELVLNLFSSTALTQINLLNKSQLGKTKWQPFDYGNTRKGAFVRVRFDAYDSETGSKHNGRLGILVDIHAYRCKVKYIGIPVADIMVHPMENLETLRKV